MPPEKEPPGGVKGANATGTPPRPSGGAMALAFDIMFGRRFESHADAARAIEAYRHRAPEDPPQISSKAFAAVAVAVAAGAFDREQEQVPMPASPDDIVKEIATFIEEDVGEGAPQGETAHARIARAARMLSKFRGRYTWGESDTEALSAAVEDTADALFDVLDDSTADRLDGELAMRAGVLLEAAYLSIGKPAKTPWILKPPAPGPDTPEPERRTDRTDGKPPHG